VFFKKNPEELEFEFRRYLNMATGKFLQKSNESDMYKSSWISFSKD
jgi:phosphoglycerol transferase MdoB-like AlkP superfamily enzyme